MLTKIFEIVCSCMAYIHRKFGYLIFLHLWQQCVIGLLHMKNIHPLWNIYFTPCTEGDWFSDRLTYFAVPLEIFHAPLCATHWSNLSQRVYACHLEMSGGLFHLSLKCGRL